MLEIFKRIRARREELGISQEELAKRLGYKSRSSINKIEKGENDIPQSKIVAFAQALQTTPECLMGWAQPTATALPNIPNIFPLKTKKVPLLGTIAAGTPIYAEENFDGYRESTEDVHADFCLKIKGDSMIGARINDGDIVFIRKQPDVENGEIAAVLIDGEATLKRVYKKNGALVLQAENPKYAPIVCSAKTCDECIIMGKAVTFQSDVV
jgi:repressor LexA